MQGNAKAVIGCRDCSEMEMARRREERTERREEKGRGREGELAREVEGESWKQDEERSRSRATALGGDRLCVCGRAPTPTWPWASAASFWFQQQFRHRQFIVLLCCLSSCCPSLQIPVRLPARHFSIPDVARPAGVCRHYAIRRRSCHWISHASSRATSDHPAA